MKTCEAEERVEVLDAQQLVANAKRPAAAATEQVYGPCGRALHEST
jgi:hypothetical protein